MLGNVCEVDDRDLLRSIRISLLILRAASRLDTWMQKRPRPRKAARYAAWVTPTSYDNDVLAGCSLRVNQLLVDSLDDNDKSILKFPTATTMNA